MLLSQGFLSQVFLSKRIPNTFRFLYRLNIMRNRIDAFYALVFVVAMVLFFTDAAVHADFPPLFNTEPVSDDSLMPASAAAEAMKLPEGFVAKVFAAEPDVQNPIDGAWDKRGRLWIAENYTYAERDQRFQLDLHDRVVILDGTTGDRFTKRTVFTDNVQMLTGLEVGRGGVWLMCPPKLLFIPDANGDDVPDGPAETILDGFHVADANYHNFANGIRFGPDGWLYGRCGGSCPGRIGRPGTPDAQRLALEGGIWRYHPIRKTVEVLNSGTTNPWGHDWNDVGEMFFVNTVNGHLWHLIQGSHLTRPFLLDPYRRTYEQIDFHADHWHFDTNGNWTESRDGAANDFGGGHAHSGTMIYQGNAWPERYRGNLFTLNFHGRRANQEILERRGSGYVARHGDDFLIAGDKWFRGMDLTSGPDGNVFVLDWSDAGECHEHTGVHRTSGRIFKIRQADDARKIPIPGWTAPEILKGLFSDNVWHRTQARMAYWDSPEPSVTAELHRARLNFKSSADTVQALLTLHGAGQLSAATIQSYLSFDDEHVRAWAVRLATEHLPIDDAMGIGWKSNQEIKMDLKLHQRLVNMARRESSALVRLTLASTLQRLPVEFRASLAKELVRFGNDTPDHNLPLLIWHGLIPVAEQDPNGILDVAKACELRTTLRLISRCAAEQIQRYPEVVDELLIYSGRRGTVQQHIVLHGLSEGLKGWQQAPKPDYWDEFVGIAASHHDEVIRELSVVFGDGRAMNELVDIALGKSEASDEIRLASLEQLIQINPPELRDVCEKLLSNNRLNVMAARGLSQFDDPEIGKAIVSRYRNFRAPFRPQVMSILASRPSFASAVLHAIKQGKIKREDLSAFQVRQILSLGDDSVSALVREVWGDVRETSAEKKERIESLKNDLSPDVLAKADKSAGRALFAKTCQTCHRLYGQGGKIGPDLTGSNRNNLDYLLGNIVDPSSVVDKDYRMTNLLLEDGRVINGLVTDESERTISVQTATEALVLDKAQVEQRRVTDKSSMPEGLIDQLTDQQVRDLISYLSHSTQVSLP